MVLQPDTNQNDNGKHACLDALNILLVDDDQNLVTTLSHGLRKAMGNAISVSSCCSSPEALALLTTQAFDLVISDFHMPAMSGLELLKKIRQDHCGMSLVLITAFGTEVLEEEVHQLGFGYIAKPFGMPLLVQIIHDLIRGKETKETKKPPPIAALGDNSEPGHLMNNANGS